MIIGREKEIKRLHRTLSAEYSEFIAVYGRRRVGKTFLVKEAFDYSFAFQHSGIANGDMRMQLEEFQVYGRRRQSPVRGLDVEGVFARAHCLERACV